MSGTSQLLQHLDRDIVVEQRVLLVQRRSWLAENSGISRAHYLDALLQLIDSQSRFE